ncbi:MAG: PHP domain-containing protein, partial [Acetatifactor sp.]|nr:PHP domain-containing protein [Acetatifactor sp.]
MKPFFETFPTLKLNNPLHDRMEQTSVERVSATRRKDILRIYLFSTRLILKEDIRQTENEIKKQLFPNANLMVKIQERFELSSQYTPENLMEAYRDSILEELREYSHIEYNAFRQAEIAYPENDRMVLTLEDTVINRGRESELMRVLEKILVERCGFSVKLETAYRAAGTGKFAEDDALKIKMKVNEISRRLNRSGIGGGLPAEEAASIGKADETVPASDPPGKAIGESQPAAGTVRSFQGKGELQRGEFRKGEFRKGDSRRGEFRRGGDSFKRSDNPDVVYGRDFEEEAMHIEDVIGEMGDVVIRGKVLKLDTREIKNEKSIILFNVTDFTDTMTVKLFAKNEHVREITGGIKPGSFVKIKGLSVMDKFDHELTIGSIVGIKKIPDFTTVRVDTAPHKRVELHCHTKMSDMDGVSEAKDIVKRAFKWGHRAIAIT